MDHVLIAAPAAKVYAALSTPEGIGNWWDKQTATETDGGVVLEHNPGAEHGVVRLRVVELVPDKRVEWECISTHPKSSPAFAWSGTHFIFDIVERDNREGSHGRVTALDFTQTGYDERSEFFDSNKSAWGQVLQNLKRVVESQRR
jgi:uncharacterized protein YndB with AHSA1/START domain